MCEGGNAWILLMLLEHAHVSKANSALGHSLALSSASCVHICVRQKYRLSRCPP